MRGMNRVLGAKMGIGANIQAMRQAAGLTQEQLAEAVGVLRQTVTKSSF